MAKKQKQQEYVTCVGRILFPHLLAPNTGGRYPSDCYELTFIIDKNDGWDSAEMKELKTAMLKQARRYFDDDSLTFKDFAHPFIDGDSKKQEYLHGYFKINPKSKYPVPVAGPDGVTIFTDAQIKTIKNGDYVRLLVAPYCYGDEPGEEGGVALGLRLVQYSHAGKEIKVGAGVEEKLKLLGALKVKLDDVTDEDSDDFEEEAPPAKKPKPLKKLKERGDDAEEDDLQDNDGIVI